MDKMVEKETLQSKWIFGETLLAPGVKPTGFLSVSQELLQEIVSRIVFSLHPEKIILFGSYAKGHPTADSDVDLLVIMETNERPVERYLAVSRLLRPRPFPMDIIVRTPEEILTALKQEDVFFREILETGRVLYDHTE
ncbi:MAG: nucleotidyltransferase domain-containing protein [Chloroflexota bacterium]|jgi:predicted nucleotidyltransferase